MEYQDFTIELRSAGSGRFEATAVDAPIRRSPRIFFPAPIEKEKLRDLLSAFDRPGAELAQGPPPKVSPRRLGETLYSALFQDGMGDLFRECQAEIPRDRRSGLRLRLRFPLDDPEADYLAALPWEWLWDPKPSEFLATDLCTPVIRDPAAGQRRGTLDVGSPLRILVVDAAPGTMKELNLKLEIERMSEALGPLVDAGHVELLELKERTPESLREVLRNAEKEIHVLHFMGHAGYDPESGFGAVFFVRQDRGKDQVSGEMLATYLKDVPSLRLVVLNACMTARHGRGLGASFNEGVASAVLARTEVQAVVANQYSISDSSAISFSAAFYGQIAAGHGVDEAITEARLRLKPRTSEWATPVLFLTS
ncbi:MAG TPA: CHAT domain-containing protein, partial [Thermoanaerobaculia bacterium]|nr:CHAT domain-containing protein [Thermoanaerobaculia bacterium]